MDDSLGMYDSRIRRRSSSDFMSSMIRGSIWGGGDCDFSNFDLR